MHYIMKYSSPLGEITVAADGESVVGLWLDGQKYFFGTDGKLFSHVFEENGEDMVCLHLKEAQEPICFPAGSSTDK